MKTNATSYRAPLARARTSLYAIAAAGLVLGGLGTAPSRADILYVTLGNNTIEKITSTGSASVFASTGLNIPRGLAFDGAGNLYAANYGDGTIKKFTPGGSGSLFASGGSSSGVGGLAFDTAGNLYVANQNTSSISKFTPGGAGSTFYSDGITTRPQLNSAFGLAFDSASNLYVSDFGSSPTLGRHIERITPGGSASVWELIGFPAGVAFDHSDNLYVSTFSNTINKYRPDGSFDSVFASTGLSTPVGLAFDSTGNLYAANNGNNTIEKFSSTGVDLGVFATSAVLGNSAPVSLAFTTDAGASLLLPQSVPEPAALAVGLLCMSTALTTRRRANVKF